MNKKSKLYNYEVYVKDVYDGDTITVAFPFGDKMFSWNCRLTGVDTPEIRTRNKQEKEFGHGRQAVDSSLQPRVVPYPQARRPPKSTWRVVEAEAREGPPR